MSTPSGYTPLVIMPHMALGDQFICHGLVRTTADLKHTVLLLAQAGNIETVRWMYRDHPRINVIAVSDDHEAFERCKAFEAAGIPVKKLGFHGGDPEFSAHEYDQGFYRQAGVPFEHRWSHFAVMGENPFAIDGGAYPCIAHEDERFKINWGAWAWGSFRLIDRSRQNLFDWLPVITHAREIHCIPSSVALLIDSLPEVPGQQLYLHKYSRPNVTYPTYRKPWIMIE